MEWGLVALFLLIIALRGNGGCLGALTLVALLLGMILLVAL